MKRAAWFVAAFLCACPPKPDPQSPPQPQPQADATPTEAEPIPPNGIKRSELAGYWTGNWGNLVLQVVGDEVHGAYTHDTGTVMGVYGADGIFRGWWCEVPSRKPTADAGEVEFRFARGGESLDLDGRWRYGTEGDWREDWDVRRVEDAPPADLMERFKDASAFCRHP